VHGLNGNAFDTWVAHNDVLWLGDLLPEDRQDRPSVFKKSRIMIFGYSSGLTDTRNHRTRLADYAHQLLSRLLYLRQTLDDKSRPIILVGHSMGGLVSRLAVMRLQTMPNDYGELTPRHFGLLFLSTPHYGSQIGEGVPFKTFMRARAEFVRELSAFNMSVVDAVAIFQQINPRPPIKCLCEGQPTRYAGVLSGFVRGLLQWYPL